MTRIIKIATIIFQVGLTIVTTFILYMIFAMFDYRGGIANFVGLTLFQPIFAILLSIRMDGMDITQTVPNQILSISGWFLVAFGTLHTYLPKIFQDKIEKFISKKPNLQTK